MAVPKFDDLYTEVVKSLQQLGGSGSTSEINDKVGELLNLSEDDVNAIHRGNTTKLNYRLAWTRTYLKQYGLIENSARGVWSLTAKGKDITSVDKNIINKFVRGYNEGLKIAQSEKDNVTHSTEDSLELWKDELLNEIKQKSPEAFERLCQRILREAGFIQVTVTGRSGDGGIDGTGIVRIGGFLSFRVIFQCKRYQGSVTSQQIREFKGTMVGRADKGLFMTTGTFTRDAKMEASRDGAPPVDLVDGELLAEKMKELGLGVKVTTKEVIEVDKEWLVNF